MRHFLVLFDDLSIDKASVKAGTNSPEVITACRCVNVGLFISGDLRRDVTVSIAKGSLDDLIVFSFAGNTLKRVSPDERSISFFLLKADQVGENLILDESKTLDNGIVVNRTGLMNFIERCSPVRVFVAHDEEEPEAMTPDIVADSLLVYPVGNRTTFISTRFVRDYVTLSYTPHPERFILDINMLEDSREIDS
ncbi:MAG: hypothetical protein JW779_00340 [Candidatus Thorarchaeota archaeon]|nr:hypothetical protein [Candidatus Thorarchaeota archaeon]